MDRQQTQPKERTNYDKGNMIEFFILQFDMVDEKILMKDVYISHQLLAFGL